MTKPIIENILDEHRASSEEKATHSLLEQLELTLDESTLFEIPFRANHILLGKREMQQLEKHERLRRYLVENEIQALEVNEETYCRVADIISPTKTLC